MRKWIFFSFSLLYCCVVFAQPANDNCEEATPITEIENFCSRTAAFTNVDATPSGYDASTCFSGATNDVWFSFVALKTDVIIIIRGNTVVAPGGTLNRPEATLYDGSCGGVLQELECQTDNENNDIIELYQGGLILGQTYLIRVQGRGGEMGTFQLCLNNFNPPVSPTSDCPDASILCDKSGFSVQKVTGAGRDRTELDDALCFSGGISTNNESNSTWYTWICNDPGTLTFTLTPSNETDDLDFVLYELPNGVGDCRGKRVVRCMASGDSAFPSRCMGPTGLMDGDRDEDEPAGCRRNSQNNFLRPLDMEEGKAYALGINNFTSTDNGFTIEFGGTGTFRGPEANFTLDASIIVGEEDNAICLNEEISFIDSSFFDAGQITAWTWTFGVGSTPINRDGEGPHNVTYTSAGEKIIALTVETDLGCTVTETAKIIVTEPPTIEFDLSLPDCGGGENGGISLTAIGENAPYSFFWEDEGGFMVGGNQRDSLEEGTYTVLVRDAENCTSELFEIMLPEDSIQLNESIIPVIEPSCTGFDDGILLVSPIKGNAPYEFDYGNGFVSDSALNNITAGEYTVNVRDANGCNSMFSIFVREPDSLKLVISPTNISCKGIVDGFIESTVEGGVGNYTYLWSTQATTSSIDELAEGQYSLSVQDANGCETVEITNIIEPEGIDFDIADIIDSGCPGVPGGRIILNTAGGTPPYEFGVVDGATQVDSTFNQLFAGTYQLFVRDSRGCLGDTLEAEVGEPPAFFVDAGEDQTIDLGFEADLEAVVFPFGKVVDFSWEEADSLGLTCDDCPDPSVAPFNTTEYTVTIIDGDGCISTDVVTVIVNKERPIYIPTAFSPESNNTGNRNFTLFGGKASREIRNLKIFTRWGDLVFETNNVPIGAIDEGWDGTFNGKMMNSGVYVFYAEVEFIDGVVVDYEGDVTLLR
ncbi:MAG: gliding motility-associated C-terminal domain-containing protein [Bacteroidota bacterium]